MSVDGRKRPYYLHDIVAYFALGPRPPELMVLHDDGNGLNNSPQNLSYGTQTQNMLDAVRHGHNHNANKTECIRGHKFTPENTLPNGSPNHRKCRACKNENERQRRASLKI